MRLLQLVSPALPVGAYTYSQGLEWVVDCGAVKSEAQVGEWIGDALAGAFGGYELPLLARLQDAWRAGDDGQVAALNARCLASRETSELRAETVQMGYSLVRLLVDLPAFAEQPGWVARLKAVDEPAFPTAWAAAAVAWQVPAADALGGYAWAWLENMVMAAVKAVPLGQAAGQRLLSSLAAQVPERVADALQRPPEAWSNFQPGLAIASCRHETQYSRLFRS
ncbi:urease accessory protein UreF [Zoogloea sp. LCSB751]|uniref:urease accessory protein UreF n=1 Tax=Zoogloea sp. LCSB751 TaxID=1965277 RepID=UPI0009A5382D|nr:urease accessory UreF family protein [Zoogloea sp. LCSB751]